METDRFAKVTEGQRACLRMVLLHMSSKDIARVLDISPHTVDQRIKLAMRTVGAASRIEAARMLAVAEQGGGYQGLIHQSPDIDASPGLSTKVPHIGEGQAAGPAAAKGIGIPLPPSSGKAGGHDTFQRIAWIMAIAAAAAVCFAALFIGLNALSEFTR